MHKLYIHRAPGHPLMVSEDVIDDRRLGWGARGVLIYLLTRGNNALINTEELMQTSPTGEDEVERALAELMSAGYLDHVDEAGREVLVRAPSTRYKGQHASDPRQPDASEQIKDGPEIRFVYLVHDGTGAYKIGYTKDLSKRIWGQIQPAYPRRLELIHAIETEYAEALEAYWHSRFADKRLNGEWFALTEEDVECFKRGFAFTKRGRPSAASKDHTRR